ncbi:MAG: nuclear transport factor 2 family protein [Henriciella sp.]|uniref:nuclear transport factor 2 family protein n=1 Tax=Henriciella sp. TaxID=1968823 RepID=UPI003C71FE55
MKYLHTIVAIGLLAACAPATTEPAAEAQAPPVDAEMEVVEAAEASASAENIVKGVYQGFEYGDMDAVTASFSRDIIWNEAENSPYSDQNPYEGADEIVTGLFARLGGEWDFFNAVPSEFISESDKVVAIGRYTAKHARSGKEMDIPFVHVWTVEDGEITGFQQYTDTLGHTEAMVADE